MYYVNPCTVGRLDNMPGNPEKVSSLTKKCQMVRSSTLKMQNSICTDSLCSTFVLEWTENTLNGSHLANFPFNLDMNFIIPICKLTLDATVSCNKPYSSILHSHTIKIVLMSYRACSCNMLCIPLTLVYVRFKSGHQQHWLWHSTNRDQQS